MSEEIVVCWKCQYKCVKSQIMKTAGKCPKCGNIIDSNINSAQKAAGNLNA